MKSTNNEEKVEIIKPKSKKKSDNNSDIKNMYETNKKYISPILMGIVGLILLTNSDDIIILACYIIGGLILGFGIYNIVGYYQLKKQLNIENASKMSSGIVIITIGGIIILLASFIKSFLNLFLGVWLIASGIAKLITVSTLYNTDKKTANLCLIQSVIVILMGLYSILFQNIILTIIGAWMIICSIIDLYEIFKK